MRVPCAWRHQCLDAIRAEAAAAKLCTEEAYDEPAAEHDIGAVRGRSPGGSGGGTGLFNLVVNAAHHVRG